MKARSLAPEFPGRDGSARPTAARGDGSRAGGRPRGDNSGSPAISSPKENPA